MSDPRLSEKYRRRIEKRMKEVESAITGDGPKQIHHWPAPKRRKDRRVVLEILEERKRGIGPESPDWHWTEQKIRDVERAISTRRFIVLFSVTFSSLIVALILGIMGLF